MTRNDYLRLRREWRAKRDNLIQVLMAEMPSLSEEQARAMADKQMGYSPRPQSGSSGQQSHRKTRGLRFANNVGVALRLHATGEG